MIYVSLDVNNATWDPLVTGQMLKTLGNQVVNSDLNYQLQKGIGW